MVTFVQAAFPGKSLPARHWLHQAEVAEWQEMLSIKGAPILEVGGSGEMRASDFYFVKLLRALGHCFDLMPIVFYSSRGGTE